MSLATSARRPFVGLALAAAIGIVLGEFVRPPEYALALACGVTATAGIILLLWPNSVLTYALVLFSFAVLHNLRTSATPGLQLATALGERPRVVAVSGVVISEPKVAGNGTATFLLHLTAIESEGHSQPGDATIQVRWKGAPSFGDEFRFFGRAEPIAPPRNPGEFDMRSYLERRDVRRVLFVRYPEDGSLLRTGGGNPILRVAQVSRQWLQTTLCQGLDDSPDVRDFISGITLGLRHQTPEDIEEPFQQTGTLHLFAVAGLHVGIVAQLLWMAAGAVGIPRRWAPAGIIPLVLFYSAVTGLHISSVRAAVMSAVFMGGFIVERRVFTLNSLAAAAVLLLCWNTNELFSTGFQLSFAVVAAIVLLADPLSKLFRRYTAPDPFLPRLLLSGSRRLADPVLVKLGQSTSISIAAWAGSLGLLFWYFHLVTPVSLVANLVVVPIAFLILAVALVAVVVAPVSSSFSVVFNNANWCLAKVVIGIVHLFAQMPAGHTYLPHPPGLGAASARVTVLDLGSGGAVHLRTRDRDWLFDTGSQRDYNRVVRGYLHSAGVNTIDALLLSHGDAQHIGGAARLLMEMAPVMVVDNPTRDRSIIHKRLRNFFAERHFTVQAAAQGETLAVQREISCTVLYPPREFSAPAGDDQTLVLQLRFRDGPRVLLLSDSGLPTEQALLRSGADLRSDIVIKGQHHSGKSGSIPFLDAVQPQLIVATSCDFPAHERVDDQWAD